ncbi:MAG: ATP-binding protein [Fimbriimonas sp.]
MRPDLAAIVSGGPSERVVILDSADDTDILAQHVCGFLNASGGTLVLENGGRLEVEALLRRQISPPAMFSVVEELVGEKRYLCVDVPAGSAKPYVWNGQIFVRVGEQTLAAGPLATKGLVAERQLFKDRWERRKSLGLRTNGLDQDLLRRLIDQASTRRGFEFRELTDPVACLRDLGLTQGDQYTQACDVLLGSAVSMRLPQTRARAIRFEDDRGSRQIDEQLFEGPAPLVLEALLGFAKRNIEIEGRFVPGEAERVTSPKFPFVAVREGLVNALVHRDYASFSGGVALRIFPHRLEIWNSGNFPDGYQVQDLQKPEHPSVLVNPDISLGFYMLGLMERAGRGAYTILRECDRSGLEAKWSTDVPGVTLTFAPKVELRLRADHLEILNSLKLGDSIRASDVLMNERTARRRLAELVEGGYLDRIGDGPSTSYVRTDKPLG